MFAVLSSIGSIFGGSWYLLNNYNRTYNCTDNHIRVNLRDLLVGYKYSHIG